MLNRLNGEKKKILFVTGTRADFGKLKSLMINIENSSEFECFIFCTGMHTLYRYGHTFDEVRKTGFKNIYVYMNQMANYSSNMDIVLANTINGIGHYIREFRPDMIIVHGDRVETLAGAIVGSLNNILVAHIEGGELSGTVDELIRHSVSKLSHIHFVANEEAKLRLQQMGEMRDSIFEIGSPEVDVMLSDDLPTLEDAKKRYSINFDEYAIFLYHPVTTDLHNLMNNIDSIVQALNFSDLKYLLLYPNNDKGSEIILERLLTLKDEKKFKLFTSIRFEYFITLLKNAKAIVGNSSTGIREAPVFGIPSINIGDRQNNRFINDSIINVPENTETILQALNNLPAKKKPILHFGQGNSSQLFMQNLKNSKIWQISCQKQFQDYKLLS